MPPTPQPPKSYQAFIQRFPHIGEAWEQVREAESAAGFEDKTARLLKLAIAVGALREGAVHSAARKAIAAGADEKEILGVVALAASTLGFPSSVAVFSWIDEVLHP